ncbi:hypothetical protein MED01_002317 [Micromonospora sp. MED01]|uniref:hypothetical protein n=1 Tax=Micromonospora alfalfae TaxID=2911212 RepID=UPI001EE9AA9C|nr:hypothetical protein [Micromonospora alfalfae]MCG5464152.1 hypothetical protein [Micromonospora alfalfae]
MTRRMVRRCLAASAAALVAGVVAPLSAAAVLNVDFDPQGAVVVALAAVFLPQFLIAGVLLQVERPAPGGVR